MTTFRKLAWEAKFSNTISNNLYLNLLRLHFLSVQLKLTKNKSNIHKAGASQAEFLSIVPHVS